MLAVRPTEYFPRPAFFLLMRAVDRVVLADTFQYSRQSFQNRTKVRTPDGWTWMSVPLKGGQHGAPQHETRLRDHLPWPTQHARTLLYNYRTAPFWPHYGPELESLFSRTWTHLAPLNAATIGLLARWLRVDTPLTLASDLPERPATLSAVVHAAGADAVLTLPDAAPADRRALEGTDVVVRTLNVTPQPYYQNFDGFEPDMSALDVVMNYGPEAAAVIASWVG